MSELCVELFSSNDSPIMFRCKAGSYTDKEETLTIYHMEKHYIFYFTNMFSVFLSSYRNTHESLGELKKAVETVAACVPTAFLVLVQNG